MSARSLEELKKQYSGAQSQAFAGGMKGPGGPGRGPGGGRGMRAHGKPKNVKNTMKRLMSYLGIYKVKLVLVLIFMLCSTATSLIGSYILRPVINSLTEADKTVAERASYLLTMIFVMLGVYLVGVAFTYLQQRLMLVISQSAIEKIRNDLFDKIQSLPVRFFDNNSTGEVMSRFTNDVDNIGTMLDNSVVALISGSITLIGTLSMMIYTNIWLTLITLVFTPIFIFGGSAIAKMSRKYYNSQQAALGAVNGYIEESVSGQKVVKVFNHEQVCEDEFSLLNEDLRNKQIGAQFWGGVMGPIMGNTSQISYSLTAGIGGILCVLRGFDVGGLTIFVNYARQFSMPINNISQQMSTIFSALAGAERVFTILDLEPEPEEIKDVRLSDIGQEKPEEAETASLSDDEQRKSEGAEADLPSAEKQSVSKAFEKIVPIDGIKGNVQLKNVTFGYNPDKVILKDISLYAKPGQKIAFVGSTGAGKTTITNLLNRFYDIQEGSITIDGVDIRSYELDDLRRNIAMVLQDTHLFTGTVMENIRYGRLDATDDEVIEAAKTASAHSFIMRLSDGYNTVIEGDGANLSQGQRQLLNIARAALSKAPILVLDEATSSVDTRTERHIEHGMDRLMKERTTFVIAHRLSTVRNANAIMVLEHGQIIERGDHDDLITQKGRYYELYTGKKELD